MALLPPTNDLDAYTRMLLNNTHMTRTESEKLQKLAAKIKIFPKSTKIPMDYHKNE